MDAMIRYGLAGAGGITIEKDPRTGKKRQVVHAEQIYDYDKLRSNPYEWSKAAGARLDAKGIHGDDQLGVLMKVMQRATMAGLFADLIKLAPTIDKDLETRSHMRPDISGYLQQNDPMAKLQQFNASWERLLTILGGAVMGDAISLLDKLTNGLTALGDAAKAHPDAAKIVLEVAGGIAGAATIIAGAWVTMAPVIAGLKMLGMVGTPAAAATAGVATPAAAGAGGWFASLFRGAGGGLGLGFLFDHADQIKKAMEDNPASRARNLREHGSIDNVPGSHPLIEGLQAAINKLASIPLPPPVQQTVTVNAQVDLEGQKVGEIILNQMVKRMDRPGNSQFDPRIGRLDPTSPW